MRATVAGFPVLWWMSVHPFQRRVDAARHLRGSVVIFICFNLLLRQFGFAADLS